MSEPSALQRTPLYELHRQHGARFTPFAGYEMPVQYVNGILREHLHTREHASLFDVSHMGQLDVVGPGAAFALESLLPSDLAGLELGRQSYSFLLNSRAGILDDLMVFNGGEQFRLVLNASRKADDVAIIHAAIGNQCKVVIRNDLALLALQGPGAEKVLTEFSPAVGELRFMQGARFSLRGIPSLITRSGYTGEDGFEISVSASHAVQLAEQLLATNEVALAGLGARDTLRLEAGLCLYGHDLDAETTPVEAGLQWAIQKARRPDGQRAGGYPGAAVVGRQLIGGTSRRRVGLLVDGKIPVRQGAQLFDTQDCPVGKVTSGGFSPNLNRPIAMGYVDSATQSSIYTTVREKKIALTLVKMPFVAHRYCRP